MKIQSFFLIVLTINFILLLNTLFSSIVSSHDDVYINQWAVQIDGNEESAQEVADRLGYRIVDKVCLILSFLAQVF